MKHCLALGTLLTLLFLSVSALPAQAGECDEMLEWEMLFALAHDEIVDYQTDTTIELVHRIRACEVYLSRIDEFLSTYPKYCDTQNSIKDLGEMRDNVQYIKENLEAQNAGGSRY